MAPWRITGGRKVRLSVTIDDDKLSLGLTRFAESLTDFRRFWKDFFAPQFYEDVQENFAREGSYVGGWRALSPAYAAWKLQHYGPKPILQRRGTLIESLRLGGRYNVTKVTKESAIFGSTVEYLGFHQYGTARMPRRPVLFFRSHALYARLLTSYLREELRATIGNAS